MKRFAILLLAFTALFAASEARPDQEPDVTFSGSVVRLFEPEQMLELKVEAAESPTTDVSRGRIVMVGLDGARIVGTDGETLDRAHRRAWYTKDEGWARLRLGGALRVVAGPAAMRPAPGEFPEAARAGGELRVLRARSATLIRER